MKFNSYLSLNDKYFVLKDKNIVFFNTNPLVNSKQNTTFAYY